MNNSDATVMIENLASAFREQKRRDIALLLQWVGAMVAMDGEDLAIQFLTGQGMALFELRSAELKKQVDIEQIQVEARRELLAELTARLQDDELSQERLIEFLN